MSQINLLKTESNFAFFEVTLDAKEVENIFRDIFKYYSNHVTIPGFRKGKVPPKVIENRIGASAILEVATDEIKEKAHRSAMSESKLRARGGDIRWEEIGTIERNQSVTLKFAAPIMPDVKLPDIAGTELIFTPQVPEPSMKEMMLANLRRKFAEFKELGLEETAKSGDQVKISIASVFAESGEAAPFENSDVSYELGLTDNLPEFDENIYGMKVGERKTFRYMMPEDFVDERISGTELTVTVTMNKAEKVVLPEMTEEFIKERLGFESEQQLDEYANNLINYEVNASNESRKRELALEQMLAGAEVEISEDMISPELDRRVEQDELRLRRQGISLDEMLQKQGRTIKEYRDDLEPGIRQEIKRELVIAKIAEVNSIRANDRDLYMAASRIAQRYRLKPNQIKELLKNRDFAIKTYEEIVTNKVLDFLYGQVTFIVEGEPNESEGSDTSAETISESTTKGIHSDIHTDPQSLEKQDD